MAITHSMSNSFKQESMKGIHNFSVSGGDTFKIALYTSAATLGPSTTVYSATSEVTGTGYTAGGVTLTQSEPVLSGNVAFVDFADAIWEDATINAAGALIYNSSKSNRVVAIIDFGGSISSSGGDFTVQMPAADATSAIIRLT